MKVLAIGQDKYYTHRNLANYFLEFVVSRTDANIEFIGRHILALINLLLIFTLLVLLQMLLDSTNYLTRLICCSGSSHKPENFLFLLPT